MKRRIVAILMAVITLIGIWGTTTVGAAEFETDKFEKFLCLHACRCKANLSTNPINEDVCDIICPNHGKVFTVDLNEYRQNGWCTHDSVEDFGTFCPDCKQVFTYNEVKDNTYNKSSVSTETVCLHKNIVEYMASGNVYGDKNGCYEQGLFISYCDDCQQELTEPTYKEKVYEHDFNNICCKCGYSTNSEQYYEDSCEHNLEEKIIHRKVIESRGADGHYCYVDKQEYCSKCDEFIGNVYGENVVEPHNLINGKCSLCDYSNIKTAWVYNTGGIGLILRSKPTKSSERLANMPDGTQISVIYEDKYSNGFVGVIYNGRQGYAHSDYISYQKPTLNTSTPTSSNYVLPFSSSTARITVLDNYYGRKNSPHPTYFNGSVLGDIDFATTGDAVAISNGTVVEANSSTWNSGWGRYVILKLDTTGEFAFYGHLAKINITKGQRVSQGQVIAVIGSSGNSTGTHLHFALASAQKNTLYAIEHFKQYKNRLRFDADIVSGGGNNSSIISWIKEHYYLQNGVYYPNSKSVAMVANTSTPTVSSTQQSSSNTKTTFVNANLTAWKNVLSAQAEASEVVIDVINSVNLNTAVQKVLGASIPAVITLSPTKLMGAVDEDVALAALSMVVTNEYYRNATTAYNRFLSCVKNGISTNAQAEQAFKYYKAAISGYAAVINGNYETVSSYASGKTYTKKMLDTFALAVIDGSISEATTLKKIADGTLNMAELLEKVKSHSVMYNHYNKTSNQWDSIWAKIK